MASVQAKERFPVRAEAHVHHPRRGSRVQELHRLRKMGRGPYQRLLQSLSIGDADKRADVNHRTAAERSRAGDESSERRALRRLTS